MSDYNGWKNYETWAYKLWLDNERASYELWAKHTERIWQKSKKTEIWTRRQTATFELEQTLEAWAEENAPDLGASVWADLLGAAMSEIDWREIAENLLSEHFEVNEHGKRVSDGAGA